MQRTQNIGPGEQRAFHVREAAAVYRLSRSTIYKMMAAENSGRSESAGAG